MKRIYLIIYKFLMRLFMFFVHLFLIFVLTVSYIIAYFIFLVLGFPY